MGSKRHLPLVSIPFEAVELLPHPGLSHAPSAGQPHALPLTRAFQSLLHQ